MIAEATRALAEDLWRAADRERDPRIARRLRLQASSVHTAALLIEVGITPEETNGRITRI